MLKDVISRLGAEVPDLQGRVDGGRAFTDLLRENKLPSKSVAAFVFPSGLTGEKPDVGAGVYSQMIGHRVSVALYVQSFDRTGQRAMDRLDDLINLVIRALAGWAPNNEVGVFHFIRGQMVDVGGGRVAWVLDFTINDELEVT